MTVTLEASEIAERDFVVSYGTVKKVVEHHDSRTGELSTLDFTFWNGEEKTGVDPNDIFDVIEGGRTDHGPIGSIRPDLAADHAND